MNQNPIPAEPEVFEAPQQSQVISDFLRVAWHRKGILVLGILLGLGGGLLFFMQSDPVYQSMLRYWWRRKNVHSISPAPTWPWWRRWKIIWPRTHNSCTAI